MLSSLVALAISPSTQAACAYNGACGTITFLGKTADLRQAVFLSQTTTPGPFIVTPTEAGTNSGIPIDNWTTIGPNSRITVSNYPMTWGGTHILSSLLGVNVPGAYIASATQTPNGRIYPNGYTSPDSRPPVTIIHVAVPAGQTDEVTVNQAQPPVTSPSDSQIVDVQATLPPPPATGFARPYPGAADSNHCCQS